MYFLNPLCSHMNQSMLEDKNIDQFWSFDNRDAEEKFDGKWNPLFYSKNVFLTENDTSQDESEYDMIFLGMDKGRKKIIDQLNVYAESKGLKTYFRIPHDMTEYMKYDDYIKLVKRSKAIVEILQDGQAGFSFRTMEALFRRRKLVTTNQNIIHAPFYNENNMFV